MVDNYIQSNFSSSLNPVSHSDREMVSVNLSRNYQNAHSIDNHKINDTLSPDPSQRSL